MKRDLAELPAPALLTVTQIKRRERDLRMLTEYVNLIKEDPLRSRTAVNDYLMKKYHLASLDGYYTAIKRAVADNGTPKKLVADYNRLQGIK